MLPSACLHVPRTGVTSIRRGWGLVWPEYRGHREPVHAEFSWGFARDPWDRMVSTYHVIERMLPPPWLRHRKVMPPFRDWVLHGLQTWTFGRVWTRPASHWLEGATWVGLYEERDAGIRELAGHLNRDPGPALSEHRNATERAPYHEYYDADTKAVVKERFKEDIDAFGYRFRSLAVR